MGVVIHLDSQGSGDGGLTFKYTATNYADLLTKTGMVEGDLAIVYNAQGVWPINRRLAGVYIYQSGAWGYANQELQDQLIASEWKVRTSASDTVGDYLANKLIPNNDTFTFNTVPPNVQLSFNIRSKIKPFISTSDPTVNDDETVLDGIAPSNPVHVVGQVWVNTTNDKSWICKDVTAGAAIWDEVSSTKDIAQSQGFKIQSILTVPTLTATTNDWNPSGFDENTDLIRVDINTNNRVITGIVKPPLGVNRILGVKNLNTVGFDIRFAHNNAGSLPENRFLCRDNNNKSIKPNEMALWFYDHINQRWTPYNRIG